jgi:hypothetical protein
MLSHPVEQVMHGIRNKFAHVFLLKPAKASAQSLTGNSERSAMQASCRNNAPEKQEAVEASL